VCVHLVGTMPCPAYVAKFSLHESHHHHHQSQTLYCGLHPLGLQTDGNLRVLDQGCKVDGGNNVKPNFVMVSPSLHICVQACTVKLRSDFCWTLVIPTHQHASRVLSAS